MELARDGSTPPLPLPPEGGRMDPSHPQPSLIVTKASISPRPNSRNSHSYPPRSDSWSEKGENRSYSHAPFSTALHSVGFEREVPGDHSRAALNRPGIHGPHPIPADRSQSRGNDRYSPPRNPTRLLGPDRQLPACYHRCSTSSTRSGPVESKRYTTKALHGPTENARSPMSNHSSPMPMLTRIGHNPVHMTPHGLGTCYCSSLIPRGHGTRCTIPVNTPSTTSRLGSRTPFCGPPTDTTPQGPPAHGISQANPHPVTTGPHANNGTMPHRSSTGTAVTPKPRPLPGNTPMAPAVGPPPACPRQATLPRSETPRPPTCRQRKQIPEIEPH